MVGRVLSSVQPASSTRVAFRCAGRSRRRVRSTGCGSRRRRRTGSARCTIGVRRRSRWRCSGSFVGRVRRAGRCRGAWCSGRRDRFGLGRSWWRCMVRCSCRRSRARRLGTAGLADIGVRRWVGRGRGGRRRRSVCSRGLRCSCGRLGAWRRSDRGVRWAVRAGCATRCRRRAWGAEGADRRRRGRAGPRGRRGQRAAWRTLPNRRVGSAWRSALTERVRVRSLSAEARHVECLC
jgi:hypothetical protein